MKKKILIGLGALMVILAATVILLPVLIPAETITARLAEQVEKSTGRKLTIEGDIKLSVFPSISIEANKVALDNASWGKEADMLTLEQLKADLALLPLLTGAVEIKKFLLVKPVVSLEVSKSGENNWTFTHADAVQTEQNIAASDAPSAEKKRAKNTFSLGNLVFGEVGMKSGRLIYHSGQTQTSKEITDIDVTFILPALADPFLIEGGFLYKRQQVDLNFSLASMERLLGGLDADVKTRIDTKNFHAEFSGVSSLADGFFLAGPVQLSSDSLRDFLKWLDIHLSIAEPALANFSTSGRLEVAQQTVSFREADIKLDDLNARGDVAIITSGKIPRIETKIETSVLDFNPYLPKGLANAKSPSTAEGAAESPSEGPAEGWSEEPIDVAFLKLFDLDSQITTAGIKVQDIVIGPSDLRASVENGILQADLAQMQLYDGMGKGIFRLEEKKGAPSMAGNFLLEDISAQPFLQAAAGFDKLQGSGDVHFDLNSVGASQKQLIHNLKGNGGMLLRDGAIKGVNLAAMFRDVSLEAIRSSFDGSQSTDFAELKGTFQAQNGVVSNSDLVMLAPIVRMTGAGNVNLPKRHVNYQIKPKLVGTLEGQGGQQEVRGLTIPVRISGPMADPSIKPDMGALITDAVADPSLLEEGWQGIEDGAGSVVKGIKSLFD